MRFIILLLITFVSLFARDNPFFPSDPNEIQTTTSNRVETLTPFNKRYIHLPNSARAVKSITISYQNLDGSISHESIELNNKIDWHEPFVIYQEQGLKANKKAKKPYKTINAKFIKFTPDGKKMRIVTKDKLLRNFMLTSPHRVVLDFSRDTSFKPKKYALNQMPFKKIRMGNHDKYYRVVIELDGQYKYKLEAREKDLDIVCY